MVSLQDFLNTLKGDTPPSGLLPHLEALWWDKKGDWDRAHRMVQRLDDRMAARIHAYLHRREGDLGNARYWYRQCGEEPFQGSLEEEWQHLVERLLRQGREIFKRGP